MLVETWAKFNVINWMGSIGTCLGVWKIPLPGNNIEFGRVTDYKWLEFIYSSIPKPCARIDHWVLWVAHVAGTKMIVDPLSWLPKPENEPNSKLGYETYQHEQFVEAIPKAMSTRQIKENSHHDMELKEVYKCIKTGKSMVQQICIGLQWSMHNYNVRVKDSDPSLLEPRHGCYSSWKVTLEGEEPNRLWTKA